MKQEIVDHGDPRKYFAAVPNIVMTLGLNPYELALYVHLKQAAGDGGVCFKSRATLAKETGMSSGMVTKARTSLAMPRKELGNKPLIRVKEEVNKEGGKPRCLVTITDIWLPNMQRFTTSPHDVEQLATSPDERATSYRDGQGHHTNEQRHHTATKKNQEEKPIKKNTEEESSDFLTELKTDPTYSRLDVGSEFGKANRWAATNHRRVTARFFVNWLNRSLENLPLNGNGHCKPDVPAAKPEPRTAEWYIKSYKLGLSLAPNYDVAKDIAMISDQVIREQVNQWWKNQCNSPARASSL